MTIALCHGYFSAVHYGHLELFRHALSMADKLVVSIAKTSPFKATEIPAELRASLVSELKVVWQTVISDDGPSAIKMIKPEIYVKGPTWETEFSEDDRREELLLCSSIGCRVVTMRGWKKWTDASRELGLK